jgi:hypothetical protein
MKKRPIFRDWMELWIPKLREEGRFGNTHVTREQVRDEAFAVFRVREEFEMKQKEWRLIKHKDDLWNQVIKAGVPEDVEPQRRSAAIKLMKMVILEGEQFEGVVPKAAEKDKEGFYNIEEV